MGTRRDGSSLRCRRSRHVERPLRRSGETHLRNTRLGLFTATINPATSWWQTNLCGSTSRRDDQGLRTYNLVSLLGDSYQTFDEAFVSQRIREYARDSGIFPTTNFGMSSTPSPCSDLKDAGRSVFIDRVKKNPSFLQYYAPSLKKVYAALERLVGSDRTVAHSCPLEKVAWASNTEQPNRSARSPDALLSVSTREKEAHQGESDHAKYHEGKCVSLLQAFSFRALRAMRGERPSGRTLRGWVGVLPSALHSQHDPRGFPLVRSRSEISIPRRLLWSRCGSGILLECAPKHLFDTVVFNPEVRKRIGQRYRWPRKENSALDFRR